MSNEINKLERQSDELFIEINNLLLGKVDNDLRNKVLNKVTEIVVKNIGITGLKIAESIDGDK